MIRRPPRSTLFPTRRSSDLIHETGDNNTGHVNLPGWYYVAVASEADVRRETPPHTAPVTLELAVVGDAAAGPDRKSTRLNSSHANISYAVFCLKKKKKRHLVRNYSVDADGRERDEDQHENQPEPWRGAEPYVRKSA